MSLETPSPDPLNIAELVKEEKPLKAIDFCYHDENEMVTILDCISMCVMVVSYASESVRGYQMLVGVSYIYKCYQPPFDKFADNFGSNITLLCEADSVTLL